MMRFFKIGQDEEGRRGGMRASSKTLSRRKSYKGPESGRLFENLALFCRGPQHDGSSQHAVGRSVGRLVGHLGYRVPNKLHESASIVSSEVE